MVPLKYLSNFLRTLEIPLINCKSHLKLGFKRTFNWNKYQSKAAIQRQNQHLDYLIDPCFQELNRLFVLSFENNAH